MSNKSAYKGVASDMRVTKDAKLINSVTPVIRQAHDCNNKVNYF